MEFNGRSGIGWGLLGVFLFAFTVPLTRIAVEAIPPLFIASARAVVATLLAVGALALTRQRIPNASQWVRLLVVGAGVVVGFPIFTSYALAHVPASHGAVVIALLPAATAVIAVLRGHERPPVRFWLLVALGALAALAFASIRAGEWGSFTIDDILLFGAVLAAAVGYSEGALLSRELGAWQTISWALVATSPVMIVLTLFSATEFTRSPTAPHWLAFAYLGVVSMFLAFFAWYRGLAIGPVATVSQIQLAQPVFSIVIAAILIGEVITAPIVIGGAITILCAWLAVRTRLAPQSR